MMNKKSDPTLKIIHILKCNCMNKYFFALVLNLFFAPGYGQNPVPAPPQQQRILLLGGTIHTGEGTVIENGAVGFESGKLKLVADASRIRIDKTAYDTVIDIRGKHVYPGLIAMNTRIGIDEIEAVRATNDFNETGSVNPSVRSLIAYNTDSKVTPTIRSNGILLAEIAPGGGLVSGQSSIVELDAWTYDDAVILPDQGIHINWPSMRIVKSGKDDADEKQLQRMVKDLDQVNKLFTDAKSYATSGNQIEKNIHLESMKGLFNGTKKLYVHCNFVKEIIAAVSMCRDLGISMVLVGGNDALMVAGLLKSQQVPVVLIKTHRLPSREDEAVDQPFTLPAQLRDSGITFAITADDFWQMRNIAFHAGTAAGHGLTKEEALQSITANPAKILNIFDRAGTLEIGKDATLIVSVGDILDMKSSNVEMAFIQGRKINLDTIQKQLNVKYRKKYGLNMANN